MCPFCIATAAWIVAGVVSTGGVSALAITTIRNKNARERDLLLERSRACAVKMNPH